MPPSETFGPPAEGGTGRNASSTLSIPQESYGKLFLRFLKFGLLAWGGPAAQIAMIRQELVEEEKWISREKFNRVLAVYQALPGPEAHEMCVYFGMQSRGRIGGLLAGLAFMLPGFVLMFLLSWFYVAYGLTSPIFLSLFLGAQPAVVALVVRAVHRIGQHALADKMLWGIALLGALCQLLGLHFLIPIAGGALVYFFFKSGHKHISVITLSLLVVGVWLAHGAGLGQDAARGGNLAIGISQTASSVPISSLFLSGLKSGLLTFGGAYTVIPYLQHDAVFVGGWMTTAQFLDGFALSGLLPAPLIIFATFVGYLGGGPLGALALTAGIFLPAFAFTLAGHGLIEHLIENKKFHSLLDGIAAAVVGLIAVTTISLFQAGISDWKGIVIFAAGLAALYRWKSKFTVVFVVIGAGLLGLALFR